MKLETLHDYMVCLQMNLRDLRIKIRDDDEYDAHDDVVDMMKLCNEALNLETKDGP